MSLSEHHFWVYLNVERPVVAWATYMARVESVRRFAEDGFVPVSMRHASLLTDALVGGQPQRIEAEVRLEALRASEYPGCVSRLTGLYFFEDQHSAERAAAWGPSFSPENLAEVGFAATATTRVDSDWITHCFQDPSADWMRRYWSGEPRSATPLWEVLVEGVGTVWGTEIRERAWNRCLAEFPESQVLLDVVRIAGEIGYFRFGVIVPWLHLTEEGSIRLDYLLDMRDAEDPAVLAGLSAYGGPRNAAMTSEIRVPDLRPYGFEVPASGGFMRSSRSAPSPPGFVDHDDGSA